MSTTPPTSATGPSSLASTEELATLIEDVSNRLQVVLGFAQILHELDPDERKDPVEAISRECDHLRATLRTLTGSARDKDGNAPWQSMSGPSQ